MNTLKIRGERITNAGLIVEILGETKTAFKTRVIDLFFPVHFTSWGEFQVDSDRQEHLREVIIGQEREIKKSDPKIERPEQ